MKKPVILIKLGGSAITDKATPYKARKNIIRRLAKEFGKRNNKYNYIIAHGSGSFGHTSASKYGGKKGYKSKIGIATVASDATRINQIVTDIFVKEEIPIMSIRPMAMIMSNEGKLTSNFFQVVEELLKQDLVPMVFGDSILDKSWKSTIYSGERTLSEIAIYFKNRGYKIEKIIEIGETDGVYDAEKKTIPKITKKNWDSFKKFVFKRNGFDTTGGMLHKIENALILADSGINTTIINNKKNSLLSAINNKYLKSTVIEKS